MVTKPALSIIFTVSISFKPGTTAKSPTFKAEITDFARSELASARAASWTKTNSVPLCTFAKPILTLSERVAPPVTIVISSPSRDWNADSYPAGEVTII